MKKNWNQNIYFHWRHYKIEGASAPDSIGDAVQNKKGAFPLGFGSFEHMWTQQSLYDAEQNNQVEIA